MDPAYRSDLRELNELNFARFDAKLEQRFAESALVFEHFARTLERTLEQQLAKFAIELGELRVELRDLRVELKDQQVVQMRWMTGMWVVVLVAVIGLWIRR